MYQQRGIEQGMNSKLGLRTVVFKTNSQLVAQQNACHKRVYGKKKSVVLNDDKPRPEPIPKDFAHLMIRRIDDAYIEFIQSRSDALVEMSEYTLKSKFHKSII